MDLFTEIFNNEFASRWTGACTGWTKMLAIAHICADFLIWIAYTIIPIVLFLVAKNHKDLPFNFFFWLFASFIVLCGMTHLMAVYTTFNPYYYMDFWIKIFTAIVSLVTAGVLYKNYKNMINMPNPFKAMAIIKQSKNDLQKVNEDLSRSNEELERFAYIASHDLKSPLRNLNNVCEWMKEDHDAGKDITEYFDRINGLTGKMNSLIDGILEFSRVGRWHIEKEFIDLGSLLNTIDGNFQVIGDMPVIEANKTRTYQVFSNIIENAFVHHHDPRNALVKVYCNDKDGEYIFCIEDNGPGISKKYHEKIFEMFQTLSSKKTSGIGLSVVKRVVEDDWKGRIHIESKEGFGTKFFITIRKDSK